MAGGKNNIGVDDRLTDREVREKLVSRGPDSLDDTELLSLLLQDNNGGCAVDMAAKVMEQVSGRFLQLSKMELRQLRMAGGMGIRRAVLVSAALELGRRMAVEEADVPKTVETNEDVVKIFRPQLAGLAHEEFWVLYLSTANTILDKAKVSQGGPSGTAVDHKVIIKRAVELLVSSVILVHNHPSGVAIPSDDDKALTNKIVTAGSLFDIAVLDHLIITQGECFSFRHAGLL